jgi:hypothetical protein
VAPDRTIHVYLFFPADQIAVAPAGFTWNIDSLKKSISIVPPPKAAN